MSNKFAFRGIVFDDVALTDVPFTKDDGYNDWSQVCQRCVETHGLAGGEDMRLEEHPGEGCICGIAGCENEAEFYIDFAEGALVKVEDEPEHSKQLFCPRCHKPLTHIIWRYVQPVDDYACWSEEGQCYEYDDSTDKGCLDCITLCPTCGRKLKDFGYNGQSEHRAPGDEPAPSKKTYVAKFTIVEGEHEHHGAFLVYAESHEEAYALAKTQEHGQAYPEDKADEKDEDAELTYWDYGDATTAARLEQIAEITGAEAAMLRCLGLAYDFNS